MKVKLFKTPGVFLAILLSSCGHGTADQADAVPATPSDQASYDKAAERALTFLDGTGFVVTRHPGGQEKNQGDSLFFTGLLTASLDCGRGAAPAQALEDMPPEFWRHRILAGKQVSLDGALAAYLAIAYRIVKCGEKARWAPFLAEHKRIGGPDVPPLFDYVRDRLFQEAGVGDAPNDNRAALEQEVALWAFAVVASKSACYRINLGLMAFETLELLGDHVGGGNFCAYTKKAGLPTVEQWCGRDGLKDYLDTYQVNQWAYRHQRCSGWESEDGGGDDGKDEQPGIDYLRAWQAFHNGGARHAEFQQTVGSGDL